MNYLDEFLLIAISHFFAVASPGPDFAIVLKQSVQCGRKHAFASSAGIALGILLHVAYCLLGVAIIIANSETLFNIFKYIAAAYLAYIGVQALRSKPSSGDSDDEQVALLCGSYRQAFTKGFLVNALNPKATLFFLSLFTLVISAATPVWVQGAYGVYMALATWLWFSFLSVVLSRQPVRDFFKRQGYWFDRAIGLVLVLLALTVVIG